MCSFSKGVGVRHSNEAEVLVILSVLLRVLGHGFHSFNDFVVPFGKKRLWRLHFSFNEIKALASNLIVIFCHEIRSTNDFADALAKQREILLGECFFSIVVL